MNAEVIYIDQAEQSMSDAYELRKVVEVLWLWHTGNPATFDELNDALHRGKRIIDAAAARNSAAESRARANAAIRDLYERK